MLFEINRSERWEDGDGAEESNLFSFCSSIWGRDFSRSRIKHNNTYTYIHLSTTRDLFVAILILYRTVSHVASIVRRFSYVSCKHKSCDTHRVRYNSNTCFTNDSPYDELCAHNIIQYNILLLLLLCTICTAAVTISLKYNIYIYI